jgi:hypothetical protein
LLISTCIATTPTEPTPPLGVPVEVGGEGGPLVVWLDDALFHILNESLFHVLYVAEAIVLSAALCGFFLAHGARHRLAVAFLAPDMATV